MPRRAAAVTQADIARAIRAVQAAGLPVVRVVVRSDGGISVETRDEPDTTNDPQWAEHVAELERIVPL